MSGYKDEYERGRKEGIIEGRKLGYLQCKKDVLELLKRNSD